MPEGMSEERRELSKPTEPAVVLTPDRKQMWTWFWKRWLDKRKNTGIRSLKLVSCETGNVDAHYFTTGPEIWEQTAAR